MFLIIKLAIYILAKIFESVTKNSPTLSGLNRLFGMIFGLAKGVVWVAVLLALCSAVSEIPVIGSTITNKIAETKVTSFAYKYVDEFVDTQLTQEKVNEIISKLTGSDGETKTEGTNTETEETPETPETPAE